MDFRTDKLLHGGDYNPEQWLKRPDILEKDIDMLEESGCNVVSLGIFSWSTPVSYTHLTLPTNSLV